MKRPCIFKDALIREEVNPRLAKLDTPLGAFMKIWREVHCREVAPYNDCPYATRECVLAYYQTADRAMHEATSSPIGYFRTLARRRGYERAESKPAWRTHGSTDEGNAGAVRPGPEEGRNMPRPRARPTALGDLLGSIDLGARQGRPPDGEEGRG